MKKKCGGNNGSWLSGLAIKSAEMLQSCQSAVLLGSAWHPGALTHTELMCFCRLNLKAPACWDCRLSQCLCRTKLLLFFCSGCVLIVPTWFCPSWQAQAILKANSFGGSRLKCVRIMEPLYLILYLYVVVDSSVPILVFSFKKFNKRC